MKTLKMKGKAPVDEYFPYADSCHVYEGQNCVWDAMLNQTNIGNNNNKYYKLQVLEKDGGGEYYYWFRWGRVGYDGQNQIGQFDVNTCIEQFKKNFMIKQ